MRYIDVIRSFLGVFFFLVFGRRKCRNLDDWITEVPQYAATCTYVRVSVVLSSEKSPQVQLVERVFAVTLNRQQQLVRGNSNHFPPSQSQVIFTISLMILYRNSRQESNRCACPWQWYPWLPHCLDALVAWAGTCYVCSSTSIMLVVQLGWLNLSLALIRLLFTSIL